MRMIERGEQDCLDFLTLLQKRGEEDNFIIEQNVLDLLKEVRSGGDAAVRKYSTLYDGACPDQLEVTKEEMERAWNQADPALKSALSKAKEQITEYHRLQVQEGYELKREGGVVLGQIIRGLERVGIYVPGGTAAYPSTVLMNAIPAKLAGVEELIMLTPPAREKNEKGEVTCRANETILAVAWLAGVDRVFLVGGAQAVAALAYGTESIPRVDKIVGPGNIYVATAKKLVFGQVDIDMIAGPSEILIIADEQANPKFIAADLMSQAEHDVLSSAILLTDSREVAEATNKEIERQMTILGRQEILEKSLANYSMAIVCKDMSEMIDLANQIAPEHLELMVKEPMNYLPQIKNAGSIFCGEYAPEPLGDYLSGTNHVLPTSGTARFASPLGVYNFIKKMSYTYYTREALAKEKQAILTIAEQEGLDAHGNAIKVRFEDERL